ncbi:MAG TPA: hypothetical protein PKH65_08160 [Bacteroidia bacterium]|nr:hypothetical protein [Bacteroidia bacterium]HNT80640.1 hypothetical protein [Bacteroidia bacterium]
MKYENFYGEVGKLLYAVADIDGKISKQEKNTLIDLVMNKMVPAESHTDEFGTDSAYYTLFAFDTAEENILSAEDAFQSFIQYVEEHKTAFDQNMLDSCLMLSEKMASAYKGTNKKESELLHRLKEHLDAIVLN